MQKLFREQADMVSTRKAAGNPKAEALRGRRCTSDSSSDVGGHYREKSTSPRKTETNKRQRTENEKL